MTSDNLCQWKDDCAWSGDDADKPFTERGRTNSKGNMGTSCKYDSLDYDASELHNQESERKQLKLFYLPHCVGFFAILASRGVMASFFPLHLKQLGLNAEQIGTVMFFRPVGGLIGGIAAPHVSLKLRGDINSMIIFSCLCLLTFFAIGWISPSSAGHCPNFNIPTINGSLNAPGVEDIRALRSHNFMYRTWMYRGDDVVRAMVLCCLLLCAADVFSVSASSVQHGITMRSLGWENSKQFGLIRAWGALGHAVAALTTGLIVSVTSTVEKVCTFVFPLDDYHFIYYVFLVFTALTIANAGYVRQWAADYAYNIVRRKACGRSSVESEKRTEDGNEGKVMPMGDIARALTSPKNVSLLFVLLCRSVFYAVTQGFVNWHLENLGASPSLIGAANCVTNTTEFVMFLVVPKLIQIFGHNKLVGAAVISYVVRFVIYSAITNPLYIFPVEVMEGVMYACLWGSSVSYLSNQVPPEGQTQVQGMLQGIEMLGIAIGFPASGVFTQIFGAPTMFIIYAILALVASLVFILTESLA